MTIITLNICEPKTSVHLNPSLDGAREIQVIDFLRIARSHIILTEPQRLYNMDDGEAELISLGDRDYTLDVLKRSLKAIDKGIEIIESNGDWYIKSRFKLKLGKGLTPNLEYQKFLQLVNFTL